MLMKKQQCLRGTDAKQPLKESPFVREFEYEANN
jgi:hypothetical protein